MKKYIVTTKVLDTESRDSREFFEDYRDFDFDFAAQIKANGINWVSVMGLDKCDKAELAKLANSTEKYIVSAYHGDDYSKAINGKGHIATRSAMVADVAKAMLNA